MEKDEFIKYKPKDLNDPSKTVQTITTETYCQAIVEMHAKLHQQQLAFVGRRDPILFHNKEGKFLELMSEFPVILCSSSLWFELYN